MNVQQTKYPYDLNVGDLIVVPGRALPGVVREVRLIRPKRRGVYRIDFDVFPTTRGLDGRIYRGQYEQVEVAAQPRVEVWQCKGCGFGLTAGEVSADECGAYCEDCGAVWNQAPRTRAGEQGGER